MREQGGPGKREQLLQKRVEEQEDIVANPWALSLDLKWPGAKPDRYARPGVLGQCMAGQRFCFV